MSEKSNIEFLALRIDFSSSEIIINPTKISAYND